VEVLCLLSDLPFLFAGKLNLGEFELEQKDIFSIAAYERIRNAICAEG